MTKPTTESNGTESTPTTNEIERAIESARHAIHNPREIEEIREDLDPEERKAFDSVLAEIDDHRDAAEPEGSA